MLIPYGTDTPLYHWPYATGGLLFLNMVGFILFGDESFYLSHGDGIHPLEWITSLFAHADIFHLIGNLMFLALFGIIVEGKTGPVLLVAIYMSTGLLQNGIEQILLMNAEYGQSLGASAAVFGLMMCAMLYAPKDNLLCVLVIFVWVAPLFFPVPIMMFALIYFLMDFSIVLWSGFPISSGLFHIMGGVIGFGAGALLLQLNFVECDDQDLFNMFRELQGKGPKKRPLTKKQLQEQEEERARQQLEKQESIERAWRSISAHFAAGNCSAAVAVYTHMHRKYPEEKWNEVQLLTVIKHFMEQQDWAAVSEHSIDYLDRFQSKTPTICLNLAKIQLLEFERPSKAIALIQKLDPNQLSEPQKKLAMQISAKAQKMRSEGTLELREE